jgi:3-hydroxyisobutyrate dehydrogenase
MVANDEASQATWLGQNGALAGAATGSLLIESSTLTGGWIHELSAKAFERNCLFIDAPVTGTKPHAASGELVFLVGGSEETVRKSRTDIFGVGAGYSTSRPDG